MTTAAIESEILNDSNDRSPFLQKFSSNEFSVRASGTFATWHLVSAFVTNAAPGETARLRVASVDAAQFSGFATWIAFTSDGFASRSTGWNVTLPRLSMTSQNIDGDWDPSPASSSRSPCTPQTCVPPWMLGIAYLPRSGGFHCLEQSQRLCICPARC